MRREIQAEMKQHKRVHAVDGTETTVITNTLQSIELPKMDWQWTYIVLNIRHFAMCKCLNAWPHTEAQARKEAE